MKKIIAVDNQVLKRSRVPLKRRKAMVYDKETGRWLDAKRTCYDVPPLRLHDIQAPSLKKRSFSESDIGLLPPPLVRDYSSSDDDYAEYEESTGSTRPLPFVDVVYLESSEGSSSDEGLK